MAAAADPLAGIGAPVGAPSAPPPGDPLAGLGAPVGTSAPPPAATPPQDQSLWGKVKGFAGAVSQGTDDPNVDIPVGFVKSAASGLGGLMHIVQGYTGNGASPSDVMEYKQQNPHASDDDAMQAVKGGYRGPTTQKANAHLAEASDWLTKHGKENGIWQNLGGVGEMAGELLSGLGVEDAAAEGGKVLSSADKLAQQVRAAKFLENNPKIAKLASIGARAVHAAVKTGAETGAQTYVHTGGDTGAATEAAALGAGTGGLIEGGLHGGKALLERAAPAVEDIAGEKVKTLSSQKPGTGPKGSVKIDEAPALQQEQQAAAPRVFKNIAQKATHDALEKANQGRRVAGQITNPARMLPAPADARPYPFTIEGPGAQSEELAGGTEPRKKQIATEYAPGKGSGTAAKTEPYNEGAFKYGDEEPLPPVSDTEPFQGPTHKEPVFQYLTDLKPGEEAGSTKVTGGGDLVAADAESAQTHLTRLNDLIDHPDPETTPAQLKAQTEARDSLQEQLDMYHTYQRTLPNFRPLQAARAAQDVGTFGGAADQLQNAARPIYQKLDEVSDGEFGRINRERAAAGKRGDFTKQYELEGKIRDMIDSSDGITHDERAQASQLWSKSMVLDGLHSAVEHAANVNERYASEVAGGRVLSGVRLQNGLNRLIQQYGPERIEGVIGRDGMENMTRISNLLNTPKGASGFKGMSMSVMHNMMHGKVGGAMGAAIGHHLGGFEGAVAGSYAGAKAERWLLQQAATNPRIGHLVDYAVRNNVTPKVAAGLISSAIIQENQPPEENTEEKK
jgi:hypothetical protein